MFSVREAAKGTVHFLVCMKLEAGFMVIRKTDFVEIVPYSYGDFHMAQRKIYILHLMLGIKKISEDQRDKTNLVVNKRMQCK